MTADWRNLALALADALDEEHFDPTRPCRKCRKYNRGACYGHDVTACEKQSWDRLVGAFDAIQKARYDEALKGAYHDTN
jgi:hypothetical protein